MSNWRAHGVFSMSLCVCLRASVCKGLLGQELNLQTRPLLVNSAQCVWLIISNKSPVYCAAFFLFLSATFHASMFSLSDLFLPSLDFSFYSSLIIKHTAPSALFPSSMCFSPLHMSSTSPAAFRVGQKLNPAGFFFKSPVTKTHWDSCGSGALTFHICNFHFKKMYSPTPSFSVITSGMCRKINYSLNIWHKYVSWKKMCLI